MYFSPSFSLPLSINKFCRTNSRRSLCSLKPLSSSLFFSWLNVVGTGVHSQILIEKKKNKSNSPRDRQQELEPKAVTKYTQSNTLLPNMKWNKQRHRFLFQILESHKKLFLSFCSTNYCQLYQFFPFQLPSIKSIFHPFLAIFTGFSSSKRTTLETSSAVNYCECRHPLNHLSLLHLESALIIIMMMMMPT